MSDKFFYPVIIIVGITFMQLILQVYKFRNNIQTDQKVVTTPLKAFHLETSIIVNPTSRFET